MKTTTLTLETLEALAVGVVTTTLGKDPLDADVAKAKVKTDRLKAKVKDPEKVRMGTIPMYDQLRLNRSDAITWRTDDASTVDRQVI